MMHGPRLHPELSCSGPGSSAEAEKVDEEGGGGRGEEEGGEGVVHVPNPRGPHLAGGE